jgi:hypothetical protein
MMLKHVSCFTFFKNLHRKLKIFLLLKKKKISLWQWWWLLWWWWFNNFFFLKISQVWTEFIVICIINWKICWQKLQTRRLIMSQFSYLQKQQQNHFKLAWKNSFLSFVKFMMIVCIFWVSLVNDRISKPNPILLYSKST